MRNTNKIFAVVFTILLLLTLMPSSVMAEGGIDKDKTGSLTVAFSPGGNPASNTEFKIYKVADVSKDGVFSILPEFEASTVTLLNLDSEGWRAAAQTLADFVDFNKLSPGKTGKIGNDGKLVFSDLGIGLYLVVGSDYETSTTIYCPESFLVSVPSCDESYKWIYDVTAEPKYEIINNSGENTITRRVLKAWKNDSREVRPSEISVSLLKDGEVYETVKLNEENNWRYQWENLSKVFRWSIVENNAPQNYSSTVELAGITFLVTNTYDEPKNPDNPSTPDKPSTPDMDMPSEEIKGFRYIGKLDIPGLRLSLPVIKEWSYPGLKRAPCCYTGSIYKDNMVIAGHNYPRHFGSLKKLRQGDEVIFTDIDGNVFDYEVFEIEILEPTAIEEMVAGDWDLTLFTCTVGGQSRVTVRCVKNDMK